MSWWLRFWLGLPARAQDPREIRDSVPELLDPEFRPLQLVDAPLFPFLLVDSDLLHRLREWVLKLS